MSQATKGSKWIDPFVVSLMGVVVLASFLPCQGLAAVWFGRLTNAAIVLLFFLHGAKLSREALVGAMLNWRLQFVTLLVTYVVFPAIGLALINIPGLEPSISAGLLYMTLLPSTVQSSIAFTSMAKGNVPGAVCAATISNVLGIFITPLLVAALMQIDGVQAQVSMDSIKKIGYLLLLPFVIGHLSRPWTGAWVARNKLLVGRSDSSSILLVVYTAFSAAVIDGLWIKCSMVTLVILVVISCAVLAFVLCLSWWLGRKLKMPREDAIVLLFCGSKKSLASGVPMAGVIFPAAQVGMIILPIMIFHQIQLVACALIARRMGELSDRETSNNVVK